MKKKMIFLLQYYFNYIIISILCWCFCIVYNILQKKCTYTLWSLEYLRLSVIGIDGGTVGMYHSPLSTFTCNKHIKEIDCELLIKGTFLHFAFHLLCPRQTHLLLVDEPSCAPANTPLELGFILLLFIFTHAMSMVTLYQAVTALFCHQFTCYCGLIGCGHSIRPSQHYFVTNLPAIAA